MSNFPHIDNSRAARKELMNTVSFLHGQLPTGQRCTAAVVSGGGFFHFSLVVCSVKDNFCRREGRHRALRRLSEYLRGLRPSFSGTFEGEGVDEQDSLRHIRMAKDSFLNNIFEGKQAGFVSI